MQKNMSEYEMMFDKLSKEMFVEQAVVKFGEDVVEKLFSRAWQFGHANGEESIKSWLRDVIDIANIVVK